ISHRLDVYAAESGTKPGAPLFSHVIDVASILGGQGYFGFTSATGSLTDYHDVLEWELSTDGIPCACEGDPVCGDAGSGEVCDDAGGICEAGCRGMGGNGCPAGEVCSSVDHSIGDCVVNSGQGGGGAGQGGSGGGGGNGGAAQSSSSSSKSAASSTSAA